MQEGRQVPDSQDIRVSIAVATYNGERYLVEQLKASPVRRGFHMN